MDTETVIHSDNDFATVAYLRIRSLSLRDKPTSESERVYFERPIVLDKLHESFYRSFLLKQPELRGKLANERLPEFSSVYEAPQASRKQGPWVCVTNVQMVPSSSPASVRGEVNYCFNIVKGKNIIPSLALVDIFFQAYSVNTLCLSPTYPSSMSSSLIWLSLRK